MKRTTKPQRRAKVFVEVAHQLAKQEAKGVAKYGESLGVWNGRDPTADAVEETVDRMNYLIQAQLERRELLLLLCEARSMFGVRCKQVGDDRHYEWLDRVQFIIERCGT